MAATAMVGILGVGLLFSNLGSPSPTGWVGVLLVLYSLMALTPWRPKVPRRAERWANPLIGLLSGAVAGSTGVAAGPVPPSRQSLDIDRTYLAQALGITAAFITSMRAECRAL